MRRALLCAALVVNLLSAVSTSSAAAIISIGGRDVAAATHAIALPAEPTPQEQVAAKELQLHLRLICGEELAVVAEAALGERVPLVIGKCDLAEGVDFDALGDDGIHIKTLGPALILAGSGRGVMYAVSVFLEDHLGCRWFAKGCSTWPTEGRVLVPQIDYRYIPPLEYRALAWPYNLPAEWAIRSRLNGQSLDRQIVPDALIGYALFGHSFSTLVPPKTHFAEHPEYFALVDGERRSSGTQLCLTNPDVLRIATEAVRAYAGHAAPGSIISVSQNDNGNYCQCDRCAALAAEEGSQSGPIIHFVNAIADAMVDEHPDVLIDTFAYRYSRKPPRHVRPRPNVIVRLCSIECIFNEPIATHPYNRSFREDLEGWAAIADRLYIWDYPVNYHHALLPHPNLYVLRPNIELFVRNHVKGVFEAATYYTSGGELAELRAYIIAKTLWDPSYDTDRAIDEFCSAYYGAAAEPIRRYVDLIHKAAADCPDLKLTCAAPPTSGFLTMELLDTAAALFDHAEEAVKDDPERLRRVKIARLTVLYAQLIFADQAPYREIDGTLVARHDWDVADLARRFTEGVRLGNVTKLRETEVSRQWPLIVPAEWLAYVTTWPKEAGVVRIANPSVELIVLPAMGGRIWRARLRESGRELFRTSGAEGAWRPVEGGYEEYSGEQWRSPVWSEPFAVVERSDRSITMTADLPNGLRMERRISLDPAKPIITVSSSLTNAGDKPVEACLRAHPEFPMAPDHNVAVSVGRPDGSRREIDIPAPALEVMLERDDVPAGVWAVVDATAGTALVNRFQAGQVWKCFIDASSPLHRANLELYSERRTLAPGEKLTLEHSYEAASMDVLQ